MDKKTLLIIDDDVDICMLLKRFFERKGYRVRNSFKGKEGVDIVKKDKIDLVLTDFRLPDKDGFEMIEAIQKISKSLPIIVITGYSDVNQAVKVIQLGAYEYVTKPIYPEEILLLVEEALHNDSDITSLESNGVSNSEKEEESSNPFDTFLIPQSSYSQNIQKQVKLVAPTNMTAVIIGESGTGKEVIARMIHQASNRRNKPFIPVDCGALTQELAGSELFGHVKGAFTGATSDKKGSFELANHGTLFLDEVGNLSYENQIKLLRVLQERVIRKVGSEKIAPIDTRIIVATNEDLKVAIEKGSFRKDIYYRINEFKISLKPLRENKNELEKYFQFFLEKSNKTLTKSVEGITIEAWNTLYSYSWPGNIRELKNVIQQAVLMAESKEIQKSNLPTEVLEYQYNPNVDYTFIENGNSSTLSLKEVTERAESKAIVQALSFADNNKTKAAEILGIDRKTLYNKLNAYSLMNDEEKK